MRNAFIGLVIGIVAGIVLGTTLIAPRLAQNENAALQLKLVPTASENAVSSVAEETEKSETTSNVDATGIRLRMASAYPAELAGFGSLAKRLESLVLTSSGGTVEVLFHPPGALVDDTEALNAVSSGAIDLYFTSMDTLADVEPSFTMFAGPPFGKSVAAYLGWMETVPARELFEEVLTEQNLHGLVCGLVPHAAGGWFRKAIVSTDDFNGLRIRASGVEAKILEQLGAEVTAFTAADTVIAMESGNLDGAQLSAPHVDVMIGTPTENGGNYYVPGWRTPASVFVLLMAKSAWEELDLRPKSLMQAACGDNIRHAIAEHESLQFEALKQIAKKGVDVRPWPNDVKSAVQRSWEVLSTARQKDDPKYSRAVKSYRQFLKGQSIWEELARP